MPEPRLGDIIANVTLGVGATFALSGAVVQVVAALSNVPQDVISLRMAVRIPTRTSRVSAL